MKDVLTPAASREADRILIEEYGIPGVELMERAAEGVAAAVRAAARVASGGRVLVLCGAGNNGGDGLAALRLLHASGVDAEAYLACGAAYRGDALVNYRRAQDAGCRILTELPPLDGYACVVDALLGTGLSRPAEGAMAALIEAVNRCGAYRVAVDIPSGVDGATGRCPGAAVLADETVTFQYPKRGLLLFPGRAQAGRLTVHPIAPVYPVKSDVHWFEEADAAALLPPRAMDSHKGKNGRALLVAGCGRYTGAALMSAMAALRGGAGLLTVAVPAALKGAFAQLPEAMCVPCGAGDAWDAAAQADAARLLGGRTALGIGSGMGEMESAPLLAEALRTGLPTVLDADALNALSRERGLLRLLHARCVLTPHPAEMARLCDCETAAVTADPVAAAREAAARFGCVVLLKGATSCISDGRDVYLNTSGNPGLAKGGSGDVLTGIALALLAQGLKPLEAACAASYLLGASADRAYAILGNRMLLAGDVIDVISQEIRAGRVR